MRRSASRGSEKEWTVATFTSQGSSGPTAAWEAVGEASNDRGSVAVGGEHHHQQQQQQQRRRWLYEHADDARGVGLTMESFCSCAGPDRSGGGGGNGCPPHRRGEGRERGGARGDGEDREAVAQTIATALDEAGGWFRPATSRHDRRKAAEEFVSVQLQVMSRGGLKGGEEERKKKWSHTANAGGRRSSEHRDSSASSGTSGSGGSGDSDSGSGGRSNGCADGDLSGRARTKKALLVQYLDTLEAAPPEVEVVLLGTPEFILATRDVRHDDLPPRLLPRAADAGVAAVPERSASPPPPPLPPPPFVSVTLEAFHAAAGEEAVAAGVGGPPRRRAADGPTRRSRRDEQSASTPPPAALLPEKEEGGEGRRGGAAAATPLRSSDCLPTTTARGGPFAQGWLVDPAGASAVEGPPLSGGLTPLEAERLKARFHAAMLD